jgi:hypothetical protein
VSIQHLRNEIRSSKFKYKKYIKPIGSGEVATRSFEIDMVLDTDEALQNFLNALESADRRGPLELPDLSAELEKGREIIAKRRWRND